MPPIEIEKPDADKVRITVEDNPHGFAYDGQDYYAGDTLDVSPGWASIFIKDGWARKAAPGAKVGRAAKPDPDAKK